MAFLPLMGNRDGRRVVVAHTLVDDEDLDRLSQFSWHLSSRGYARRSQRIGGRVVTIRLNREVMGYDGPDVVDHKNGEKLDNRKSNLRIVPQSTNAKNRRGSLRGVSRNGSGWSARAMLDRRPHHLGTFPTPEAAAAAVSDFWREHGPS